MPVYGLNKEKRVILGNFDSDYIYKKRTSMIEILVNKYFSGSLTGDLDGICEMISNRCYKRE